MLMLVDHCELCGAHIYWDESQHKKIYLCSCIEKNPDYVSDGCGEGMCIINKKKEDE